MKRSEQRIEFLSDVLITAMQGCHYWANCVELIMDVCNPSENDHATIVEDETGATKIVNHDVIARGLNRIAKGEVPVSSATLKLIKAANAQNDCMPDFTAEKANFGGYYVSDIDADVADNILQAGLFGQIYYG